MRASAETRDARDVCDAIARAVARATRATVEATTFDAMTMSRQMPSTCRRGRASLARAFDPSDEEDARAFVRRREDETRASRDDDDDDDERETV